MEAKTKSMCINNVVNGETLREIQSRTLKELADYLKNSFGPFGSTTCLKKLNALNNYTKDGHNILSSITYNGIIEQSIKDDVESITRHIVSTVGDGTTSAVLLSDKIFDVFKNDEKFQNISPAVILRKFSEVVDEVSAKIKAHGTECTLEDIYDIAMISSNGDEKISANIRDIYAEYGMGVFIDVAISNGVEDKLKTYDGVTLDLGFADPCYINDTDHNTASIRNAHIYFFEDPIDTTEMGAFLDAIISQNIIIPVNSGGKSDVTPTVIICPKISRDASVAIDSLMEQYTSAKPSTRPPFVIIEGYFDAGLIDDIAKLCGAKFIRKYIDPKVQEEDIKNGKAPTPLTIDKWAGYADEVVVSSTFTKFINPTKMYNEDGSESNVYTSLVEFLEKEVSVANDNGENASVTGPLKRRLNALKSNMVEYLVGGITVADRDAARDLVEDAVKNCRSAAANGVGYGANFEAYLATEKCQDTSDKLKLDIYQRIHQAYEEVITILYSTSGVGPEMIDESLRHTKRPINLRKMNIEPHCDVLSSIESDIVILKAISQIIGIMFTTNQFVVPTPAHNIYTEF